MSSLCLVGGQNRQGTESSRTRDEPRFFCGSGLPACSSSSRWWWVVKFWNNFNFVMKLEKSIACMHACTHDTALVPPMHADAGDVTADARVGGDSDFPQTSQSAPCHTAAIPSGMQFSPMPLFRRWLFQAQTQGCSRPGKNPGCAGFPSNALLGVKILSKPRNTHTHHMHAENILLPRIRGAWSLRAVHVPSMDNQ